MTTALQFVVLGLGTGAAYALLAQGLVVVHRGSGVVNFAHGGLAVFSAFIYVELRVDSELPAFLAVVITLALAAALGVLIYLIAVRPLRDASTLARAIGTLAVLVILESLATLRWGDGTRLASSFLSGEVWEVGDITIPVDRVVLLVIAILMTGALWAGFRYTLPGLATSAIAENRRSTAALGWSPDRLAAGTWALGAALAALAGILLASIIGASTAAMTTLLIVALAAALLGRLTSFPLVLIGSLGIGVAQALAGNYITRQGVAESVPFFVIVAVLVIQGRKLPLPSAAVERFAELGTGLIRPRLVAGTLIVFSALTLFVFSADLAGALTASIAFGIVMLSIVVLTGYAGQLSLAQLAFGGIGALVAGKFVSTQGWPFELAIVAGVVAAVPIGMAFAMLALRVRGVTLAIVTLGLGAALTKIVFDYSPITGGPDGTPVGPQTFFGIDIDAAVYPERYAVLVAFMFALCGILVANLRRSRAGRRLVAVRANERAAAALGINVYGAKLYAFGVAAAIAAVGGIMLGFQFQTIIYLGVYVPFQSVLAVAFAVVGGLGYIAGPLIAGTFIAGGLGSYLLESAIPGVDKYVPLIGGVMLLILLLQAPDGLAPAKLKAFRALLAAGRRRLGSAPLTPEIQAATEDGLSEKLEPIPAKPLELEVSGMRVQFGGVVALDDVALKVVPGQISGLIGPNGAGKTTFINAVTGFVTPSSGTIELDGQSIADWPVHRRARAGVSRSFQSLELFEDLTVRENLRVAADPRDVGAYFTGLVAPRNPPLPPAVQLAVQEFGLEEDLDKRPPELSFGRRRVVAIARALAFEPSVLMLDEPATGLDEAERREVGELIRRLADSWGLGILLVEHDVNLVMSICDTITVLDFGIQIADGPPDRVRNDPAVIAAYLGEPEPDEVPPPTRNGEGTAGLRLRETTT